MKEADYRIFESLHIAACLTFVSGFLSAFTYMTQGGRFAGVQSGNVVLLAYYIAKANWYQAGQFLIPLFFFVLGQGITYWMRRYCLKKAIPWHLTSSLVMMTLIIITFLAGPSLTMPILALVSSIQVETFRRVRDFHYANVMMTGNVKNAAYLLFKGYCEKDIQSLKRGYHVFMTILSFMLGVIIATLFVKMMKEIALLVVLIPMAYTSFELWKEKRVQKKAG